MRSLIRSRKVRRATDGSGSARSATLFVLIAGIASLVPTAAAANGFLVVDEEHRPVPGAHVEVVIVGDPQPGLTRLLATRRALETDATGRADLPLPRAGHLLIAVDHASFAPEVVEARPKQGVTHIILNRGRAWRVRTVAADVEMDGSDPLSITDGRICATGTLRLQPWARDRRWLRCAEIGPEGEVELRGLPKGVLDISVQAPGYVRLSARVDPPQVETLFLERGELVRGVVYDGAGRPVPHASVRSDDGARDEATGRGDFSLAVPSLPAGVTVRAPGFREWKQEIQSSEAIEVVLVPTEQVIGTLMSEEGEPLPHAEVWVERTLEDGSRRSTRRELETDEGAFMLDLPGPGLYQLHVKAPGHRGFRPPPFRATSGEARELGILTLSRGVGVRGVLVDGYTGEPIEGALIEVLPLGALLLSAVRVGEGRHGVSDEAGSFTVGGLEIGRYLVRMQRDGYALMPLIVDLEGHGLEDLGTMVMDSGVVLHGQLVGHDDKPRAGLQIRLFDAAQELLEPLASASSDGEGQFRLSPIAAGRYRVRVEGERLLLAQEVEVRRGQQEVELDLRVSGAGVRGRVVRNGVPVGGGVLRVAPALEPSERQGKIIIRGGPSELTYGLPQTSLLAPIDDEGFFVLEDAPVGLAWFAYLGPRGERAFRLLTLSERPDQELVLELSGHTLLGQILDGSTGMGLPASVTLFDVTGRSISALPTQADGTFQFEDLAPGRYELEARAPGFAPSRLREVVVAEESPTYSLELRREGGGSLQVALQRVDGTAVQGVPISVFDARGGLAASLPSLGDGTRAFEGLEAGEYFVGWSEPLSGARVMAGIRVGPDRRPLVERHLEPGASVVVSCPVYVCGGTAVEYLAVYSEDGLEISPLLSGVTAALRMSPAGDLSLGRMAPGRYVFRLWAGGEQWEREATVTAGDEEISLR